MSIPSVPMTPPVDVLRRSWDRPATPVWANGIGGVTWTYETPDGREFMKIGPSHPEFDVDGEVERLAWLADRLPVPQVLEAHRDADESWLVTAAIPGGNAVAPENVARAEVVVARPRAWAASLP